MDACDGAGRSKTYGANHRFDTDLQITVRQAHNLQFKSVLNDYLIVRILFYGLEYSLNILGYML